MSILWLCIFWAMQIVAALMFKYGSTTPERWWTGFIVGNLFGMTSIWFMMQLYKSMNPNVAMGLAVGGAFLLGQIALAVVFPSKLNMQQFIYQGAGLASVTLGMVLFSLGAKT